MATSSSSSSIALAALCFMFAVIGFVTIIFLNESDDDYLMVAFYVSAAGAAITVLLSILSIWQKTKRGLSVMMLLVSIFILAVYGWMYASKWMLEQSLNEMMNAQ